MKPTAILSMDIEDWYHLDYFDTSDCNVNYSLLDGIDIYRGILEKYKIISSFFVIGEIAQSINSKLRSLEKEGHEIGIHGWDHTLPMKLNVTKFESDLVRARKTIEDIIGSPTNGYRAPCFSLDSTRLSCVENSNLLYDSSRIDFGSHPLYENLELKGYEVLAPFIFKKHNFFEFEVSTHKIFNRNIPVSGGGYLRILPWLLTKKMLKEYIKKNNLFIFYIHPFELSLRANPSFPNNISRATKLRFSLGRSTVARKLNNLIQLLNENNFRFTTFSKLRNEILNKKQYEYEPTK